MLAAANEAAAASVDHWSERQYAQWLAEAIGRLSYPDPALPLRLEGRMAHLTNGRTIRLSRQQAVFLRFLIDRIGQRVTLDALRKAGITNAARIKFTLVHKLQEQGGALDLRSLPGAYVLHEFQP